MESIQKFWPLFVLLGIGVVALALIGLDSGKDGKTSDKEWEGADVVTLDSGLKYKEEKEGEGEEAVNGDEVSVVYTGRLASNKKEFDSSEKHGGQPYVFVLGTGNAIKGWHEGIAGMKLGGKRKLMIPSH